MKKIYLPKNSSSFAGFVFWGGRGCFVLFCIFFLVLFVVVVGGGFFLFVCLFCFCFKTWI